MPIDDLLEKLRRDTGQEKEALGERFRSDLRARIAGARPFSERRLAHWWQWLPEEWSMLLGRPSWAMAVIALALSSASGAAWLRYDAPSTLVPEKSALSLNYFEPFSPDSPEGRVLGYHQ